QACQGISRAEPLITAARHTAALAAILTALVRHQLRTSPMFVVTSPKPSEGKSMLVDVISKIACGREAPRNSFRTDESEMRKLIFTTAATQEPIALLDNVRDRLESSELEGALTGCELIERTPHQFRFKRAKMCGTWFATGVDVKTGTEMDRRVVRINLASSMDEPQLRTGFRHDPLLDWVGASRGSLVSAGHTILRAYITEGCPQKPGLSGFGSFEDWSRLVRGALIWIGMEDPRASAAAVEIRPTGICTPVVTNGHVSDRGADQAIGSTSASPREYETGLLSCWHVAIGERKVTTKQLLEFRAETPTQEVAHAGLMKILREECVSDDGKALSPRAIGQLLSQRIDQPVSGLVLRSVGRGNGGQRWWLSDKS
ncbi:MAG: hypothetical protein AAB074_18030, partial [Planctomycetota bacterium]